MISEKNAQKREEASATAALCATKPIFTKMGHGMDYLQETVRQTQKANLKQAAVVNQRQYETERYVGKLIEEQDTIRQSIETSKEIQQAQNTRLDQRLSNMVEKLNSAKFSSTKSSEKFPNPSSFTSALTARAKGHPHIVT